MKIAKNLFQNPWMMSTLVLFAFLGMSMINTTAHRANEEGAFNDCTVGEIMMFAGDFAPRNTAFCNGELLSIQNNQALFSVIGTIYGGDGRTTMGLPDLRGRVPMQSGQGNGLVNRPLGTMGGSETTTQVPTHTHTAQATGGEVKVMASGESPASLKYGEDTGVSGQYTTALSAHQTNKIYDIPASANNGVPLGGVSMVAPAVTVNPAGSPTAITNMQPYQVINYVICTYGQFPARN